MGDEAVLAAEPVDLTAPTTDEGQAPAAEPKYVADDYVIPADDEAWPKALRGQTVAKAKEQTARWEHEITTANAQNREDRKEQREIWRALLDRTTPQPHAQQPAPAPLPQVYIDIGNGQVAPISIDKLLEPHLAPFRQQLSQVNDAAVFGSVDHARELARMQIPGMDPQTWSEMAPEFGAFMSANKIDGRDPAAWVQVHSYFMDRARKFAARAAAAPQLAAPPVGSATSQGRNRDREGYRLSADQQRHADNLAEDMGLSKNSKDPKVAKLYKDFMKEAEQHYSNREA
jgi:hypothetical protein